MLRVNGRRCRITSVNGAHGHVSGGGLATQDELAALARGRGSLVAAIDLWCRWAWYVEFYPSSVSSAGGGGIAAMASGRMTGGFAHRNGIRLVPGGRLLAVRKPGRCPPILAVTGVRRDVTELLGRRAWFCDRGCQRSRPGRAAARGRGDSA